MHGLCRSRGIFPDQGSNPCPLHCILYDWTTRDALCAIDLRFFLRLYKGRIKALLMPQTFFENDSNDMIASCMSHSSPCTFLRGRGYHSAGPISPGTFSDAVTNALLLQRPGPRGEGLVRCPVIPLCRLLSSEMAHPLSFLRVCDISALSLPGSVSASVVKLVWCC